MPEDDQESKDAIAERPPRAASASTRSKGSQPQSKKSSGAKSEKADVVCVPHCLFRSLANPTEAKLTSKRGWPEGRGEGPISS